MKIIRYSIAGFKTQEQTYHAHLLDKFNIEDYPEFMRWQIQCIHEQKVTFYKEHLKDFKRGIWCFVDGHKSINH